MIVISLVAAAALAGCNKENPTLASGNDSGNTNAVGPVVLPPAVAASKIYRCGDNSVVFVDWLADNKSANVRTEATGTPTQVVAAEPGKPLTGNGISLTGSAGGSSVTIERSGHGSQTCNV